MTLLYASTYIKHLIPCTSVRPSQNHRKTQGKWSILKTCESALQRKHSEGYLESPHKDNRWTPNPGINKCICSSGCAHGNSILGWFPQDWWLRTWRNVLRGCASFLKANGSLGQCLRELWIKLEIDQSAISKIYTEPEEMRAFRFCFPRYCSWQKENVNCLNIHSQYHFHPDPNLGLLVLW